MIELSEMYPYSSECKTPLTEKMWKSKNKEWKDYEEENSTYFPWLNPIAKTLHNVDNDEVLASIRSEILSLTNNFPLYPELDA